MKLPFRYRLMHIQGFVVRSHVTNHYDLAMMVLSFHFASSLLPKFLKRFFLLIRLNILAMVYQYTVGLTFGFRGCRASCMPLLIIKVIITDMTCYVCVHDNFRKTDIFCRHYIYILVRHFTQST